MRFGTKILNPKQAFVKGLMCFQLLRNLSEQK